jgi:hypothetical protein
MRIFTQSSEVFGSPTIQGGTSQRSCHRKIDAGKLVLRLGKPEELVINGNSAKHVENDSEPVPVSSTEASIDLRTAF